MIVKTNEYLAHYGIVGQKWGIRRYQNDDGSLTEAGKKRYQIEKKESAATKISQKTKELKTKISEKKEARAKQSNQFTRMHQSEGERRLVNAGKAELAALASAGVGSISVYALNKAGYHDAARTAYNVTKGAVDTAQIFAARNAMSAGVNFIAAYNHKKVWG